MKNSIPQVRDHDCKLFTLASGPADFFLRQGDKQHKFSKNEETELPVIIMGKVLADHPACIWL